MIWKFRVLPLNKCILLWLKRNVTLCQEALTAVKLGGSLAGKMDVPLLLSTPTCVPEVVVGELVRLGVNRVYILGGESALSSDVAELVVCS